MGSPQKGDISTRGETLAKELNLEMSNFVFDCQPGAFRIWTLYIRSQIMQQLLSICAESSQANQYIYV